MDVRHISCEECSQQSLLTILNKFVQAVNSMDEKIMIPSRLRDMQHDSANVNVSEENNNMALLPVATPGTDLHSYYVMLNAIKEEITSGKGNLENGTKKGQDELSSDSDDGCSESGATCSARKTSELFRHHLQGLFGLLHQLTDTAKFLGNTYESGVGAIRQSKKFAI